MKTLVLNLRDSLRLGYKTKEGEINDLGFTLNSDNDLDTDSVEIWMDMRVKPITKARIRELMVDLNRIIEKYRAAG